MDEIIQERLRLIMEKRRLLDKLDRKSDWTAEELSHYHAQVASKLRLIEEMDRLAEMAGNPRAQPEIYE